MKIKLLELNDEEAYAIENGDEINEGIYSPKYDTQDEDYYHDQLYCLLESIGELRYYVNRHETAERDFRAIEALIINSISKVSYNNIMELLFLWKMWLKRDIDESWETYYDLKEYVNNTFK